MAEIGHGLDEFRVIMAEEKAFSLVERANRVQVLRVQHEVEHLEVLGHALLARGFGNDGHAALDEEAQRRLGGRLAVLRAHGRERRVREEAVAALGERPSGLVRHPVAVHDLARGALLLEHVRLHLVHHGLDLAEPAEVDQAVRVEVRRADGACFAGAYAASKARQVP